MAGPKTPLGRGNDIDQMALDPVPIEHCYALDFLDAFIRAHRIRSERGRASNADGSAWRAFLEDAKDMKTRPVDARLLNIFFEALFESIVYGRTSFKKPWQLIPQANYRYADKSLTGTDIRNGVLKLSYPNGEQQTFYDIRIVIRDELADEFDLNEGRFRSDVETVRARLASSVALVKDGRSIAPKDLNKAALSKQDRRKKGAPKRDAMKAAIRKKWPNGEYLEKGRGAKSLGFKDDQTFKLALKALRDEADNLKD